MTEREAKKRLRAVKRKIKKISWFNSYQSFSELGIKGRRNDDRRYRYLDFSICSERVICDYGCNLGQSSIKAAKAGAKRVIGIDSQADTIESAVEIKDILGLENVEYHIVDFNDRDYESTIKKIFAGVKPDISFFLSVYRTKELKNRDGLFKFIIDNTKDIIFFEGHSKRSVDTVDFYNSLFSKFDLKAEFLGYSQRETRPLFIIRL
jgi:SAM-dependent methyltransferase